MSFSLRQLIISTDSFVSGNSRHENLNIDNQNAAKGNEAYFVNLPSLQTFIIRYSNEQNQRLGLCYA